MGYSRRRYGLDGKPRYTAYYHDLRGRERSAGTFPRKKDADRAWRAAEARVAEGRGMDMRRGRQRFGEYVTKTWLPNHVIEASTRQSYTYVINKYILPEFEAMPMIEIMPGAVRDFVRKMKESGASAHAIDKAKVILSAIFTTALNDQIVFLHPCKGVKVPPTPRKPLAIVTPEQFDAIYQALPDAMSRLLVETDIESGLRWGELTELRADDLDLTIGILTVTRTVMELNPKYHPTGGRYLVKPYPKNTKYRRFKLSQQVIAKLSAHISLDDSGCPRGLLLIVLCRFSAVVAGWRVAVLPDVLGVAPAPTAPGRPPSCRGTEVAGQAGAGRAHSRCQQARNASFQGQVRLIFSTRARAWRTSRAGRLSSR